MMSPPLFSVCCYCIAMLLCLYISIMLSPSSPNIIVVGAATNSIFLSQQISQQYFQSWLFSHDVSSPLLACKEMLLTTTYASCHPDELISRACTIDCTYGQSKLINELWHMCCNNGATRHRHALHEMKGHRADRSVQPTVQSG